MLVSYSVLEGTWVKSTSCLINITSSESSDSFLIAFELKDIFTIHTQIVVQGI